MNKQVHKMNERELDAGLGDASWHDDYKDSAWIYVGGLHFGLTEGDLLIVFAQYGEIEDLHLARDRDTGKSRGFAYVKYEDTRSTVLAVDNFNGSTVAGRSLRVDHCRSYREPKARPDDIEYQRELDENAEAKRRALQGFVSDDDGAGDAPRGTEEEDAFEKLKSEVAKSLGIDDEDPMRDLLVAKELKRRRKLKKEERQRARDNH